jgi:hypothetical protein
MKKIHYKNIGLPKTGTTWLWLQLSIHPDIDFFTLREGKEKVQCIVDKHKRFNANNNVKEKKFDSVEEYKKFYEPFDISLNFDTWTFITVNKEISDLTTHTSVSFRNPYDQIASWWNFFQRPYWNERMLINADERNFLNFANPTFMQFTDYEKIISDWRPYNLKPMIYDDIINDPEQYVKDVCNFLGIKEHYDSGMGSKIVLQTEYTESLKWLNDDVVKFINSKISYLEDFTKRDLSHWKKNT